MKETHDIDNVRLMISANYANSSAPCGQFCEIHLNIHRTCLVGPMPLYFKYLNCSHRIPYFFLFQEDSILRTLSALISRADSTYRQCVDSMKEIIGLFIQNAAYQSPDSPFGTLEITVDVYFMSNGLYPKEGLTVSAYLERNRQTCAICLENLVPDSGIIKTTCSHIFHEKCLTSWTKKKRSCPPCRFSL